MPLITIDLDDNVTRTLERLAESEHKSVGQMASELVTRALQAHLHDASPFEWKSHDMGEPLVDLEDKDALYRILDERG